LLGFQFSFYYRKSRKNHFPEKNRLKKPVKTQFEAVFGGFYVIPSTVLQNGYFHTIHENFRKFGKNVGSGQMKNRWQLQNFTGQPLNF
jgi:hypothetical protein